MDILDTVTRSAPRGKAVHFLGDNLTAHISQAVNEWLAAHPRVTMQDTPTYGRWLNQVERWFARLERDCIARGIFTSTAEITRTLLRYIELYNETYRSFVWRYCDPTRRMPATRKSPTAHSLLPGSVCGLHTLLNGGASSQTTEWLTTCPGANRQSERRADIHARIPSDVAISQSPEVALERSFRRIGGDYLEHLN